MSQKASELKASFYPVLYHVLKRVIPVYYIIFHRTHLQCIKVHHYYYFFLEVFCQKLSNRGNIQKQQEVIVNDMQYKAGTAESSLTSFQTLSKLKVGTFPGCGFKKLRRLAHCWQQGLAMRCSFKMLHLTSSWILLGGKYAPWIIETSLVATYL